MRHLVIVLRNAGGAEGIGFDQVGASLQVALMDCADDLRLGQGEQLVVAAHEQFASTLAAAIAGKTDEAPLRPAAIIFFRQLVLLDHGAHRAIQYQDAFGQQIAQQ